MKIALPHGWFVRIVLGGWVLFLISIVVVLLTAAFLPHSSLVAYLIKPLLILSMFLVSGTFACAAAYSVGRLHHYSRAWRGKESGSAPVFAIGPVERILAVGWLLFAAVALGTLLFSNQKWVSALGPEVLLSLLGVVGISSMSYGSYLLIRYVIRHFKRG
jgi:hypothetical protein